MPANRTHINRSLAFHPEANGPFSTVFTIGAYVIDPAGQELDRWIGRCPTAGPAVASIAENVLPAIADVPRTHSSYLAMREEFYGFVTTWGQGEETDVVAHAGVVAETTLLRDILTGAPGREWPGGLPLLDIATAPRIGGHDPHSVDGYNRTYGVVVPIDAAPQHPLYRAAATALCWGQLLRPGRRKSYRLAGQSIELGTGEHRIVVTALGWYRDVRGCGIHDETDPRYGRAVRDYVRRPGRTNGHEVLCTGPDGEPLILRSTQLDEGNRASTGEMLAEYRRADF